MIVEGGIARLERLLQHQLHSLFIFDEEVERAALSDAFGSILTRVEACFQPQANKYYHRDGQTLFDPLHTSQYAAFLYMSSNEMWRRGHVTIAKKLYALNKCLNGVELYYEVDLPRVWRCDHPVGTVIGRATFGNGFFFTQNCTVGNNKGVYPVIGDNVQMLAGATLIGNCRVGSNAVLSAQCYVKDTDIPAETVVFGRSPALVFKPLASLRPASSGRSA